MVFIIQISKLNCTHEVVGLKFSFHRHQLLLGTIGHLQALLASTSQLSIRQFSTKNICRPWEAPIDWLRLAVSTSTKIRWGMQSPTLAEFSISWFVLFMGPWRRHIEYQCGPTYIFAGHALMTWPRSGPQCLATFPLLISPLKCWLSNTIKLQ